MSQPKTGTRQWAANFIRCSPDWEGLSEILLDRLELAEKELRAIRSAARKCLNTPTVKKPCRYQGGRAGQSSNREPY